MTRAETRVATAALIEAYLAKGGTIKRVQVSKPGRKGKSDEEKIAELESEIERLKSIA